MEHWQFWSEKWDTGDAFWHLSGVNKHLKVHFHHFLAAKVNNGRNVCRVLVPLCGKTVDMKWIYDEGHEVIGVDGVEKPILDFFEEQSLEYVKELDQHGIVTFSTRDGRLKIYNCDLCDLGPTICGTFDGIWDRRSLTAIPPTDRIKYSAQLKKLQSSNCAYLIATIEYDQSQFEGPPRSVPVDDIRELFGDNSDIQVLEKWDLNAVPDGFTPEKWWKVAHLDPCHEIIVLVNRRTSSRSMIR